MNAVRRVGEGPVGFPNSNDVGVDVYTGAEAFPVDSFGMKYYFPAFRPFLDNNIHQLESSYFLSSRFFSA